MAAAQAARSGHTTSGARLNGTPTFSIGLDLAIECSAGVQAASTLSLNHFDPEAKAVLRAV